MDSRASIRSHVGMGRGECPCVCVCLRKRLVVLSQANPSAKRFAVLYLMCYAFLLRMPSEPLSMVVAGGTNELDMQPVIWFDDGKQELVLRLKRCGMCVLRNGNSSLWLEAEGRRGSLLTRECWCQACPRTCLVHVIGEIVKCG